MPLSSDILQAPSALSHTRRTDPSLSPPVESARWSPVFRRSRQPKPPPQGKPAYSSQSAPIRVIRGQNSQTLPSSSRRPLQSQKNTNPPVQPRILNINQVIPAFKTTPPILLQPLLPPMSHPFGFWPSGFVIFKI